MKALLRSIALTLGLLVAASPVYAGTPPTPYNGTQTIQNNGQGDITGVLGPNPFFSNGFVSDQFGTWYKFVADSTASTPASVGKLECYKWSTATWLQNATASLASPVGMCGVVVTSAPAVGSLAAIQVRGSVQAYCTTTGTAIALGTPLGSDAAGNLTPIASPATGAVLAIAQGTLPTSSSATLVQVQVGGY